MTISMHWPRRTFQLGAALALLAVTACGAPATKVAGNAAAANAAPANVASAAPAAPIGPASSADADAVKAYLASLYAHYKTSKNNNFDMFGRNKAEVFDPDTQKLLAEDFKLLKGDLGDVESDYLCVCQDFGSVVATITVQAATAATAHATADVSDLTMPKEGPRHVAIDLVKVGGAWRIHDISNPPDIPSLRKTLVDEIAQMKAHPELEDASNQAS